MRKQEPQIYRVPTDDGARYIHAIEVRPGILLHPSLDYVIGEGDWDEPYFGWTLTHQDSGRWIVENIPNKGWARRAASILARIENHVCEAHWLTMNEEYLRVGTLMRQKLPWTETWPAEIR